MKKENIESSILSTTNVGQSSSISDRKKRILNFFGNLRKNAIVVTVSFFWKILVVAGFIFTIMHFTSALRENLAILYNIIYSIFERMGQILNEIIEILQDSSIG